ncbi:MAG: competence/damage-inducible protein A [Flavobacteriales bacterium]|nr:MAG: competence/damage-inducible protein A [Flavobacteriales bacterium]
MKAEIITIGDEILIGQITDTNSAYICKQLNTIGIDVYQITSVQDDKKHILKALKEAEHNADIILMTGGLGPTKDDNTKETLATYFNDKLVMDDSVLENIHRIFDNYLHRPVTEINRNQALVLNKAQVLHNPFGTAPGLLITHNKKLFFSLPGVPYEMKNMVQQEVLPIISKRINRPFIIHKTLLTYGMGESIIAERLSSWEDKLPKGFKLAYLPNVNGVRLRLTGKSENLNLLQKNMELLETELKSLVSDVFTGYENNGEIEQLTGTLLKEKNYTLATAESCTGGAVAARITSVSGASVYFKGAVVSYHKTIKTEILKVPQDLIDKFTVVSEPVAKAMAIGIKNLYKTDAAIGITGNAGPTTDDTDESVGIVYIAVALKENVWVEKYNFGQPRIRVIEKSVFKALEMLKTMLLSEPPKSHF